MKPKPSPSPDSPPLYQRLRPWLRGLLSLAIVAHLFAVFAAPWSGPPPASYLSEVCAAPLRPYLNALQLNHGYRFFAPQPGPSHLIRYTLYMPDGSERNDVFPNLKEEQPRQFYHRHFMLAEYLNMLREVSHGPELSDKDRPNAERAYQAYLRSYANHLLKATGATSVKLELVRHYIPPPDLLAQGVRLDDPMFYRPPPNMPVEAGERFPVDLGVFTAADVEEQKE